MADSGMGRDQGRGGDERERPAYRRGWDERERPVNRLGAYWRDHPNGAEQDVERDRDALGNARPSRYGLSSPTNFPPARSVRSPGGLQANDDPSFYQRPRDADGSRSRSYGGSRERFRPADGLWDRAADSAASDWRRGEGDAEQEDRERLYGFAAGQKEPQFRDALQEGPWPGHVLRRRGFLLALAEWAVYAACFRLLLDPLTVLTARMGPVLSPLAAAAGVSLAGTLFCVLCWLLFRERRLPAAAWGWLLAAALIPLALLQLLLWGEVQAQWTVLRAFTFFLLGPAALNGAAAYAVFYLRWRLSQPRKEREKRKKKRGEEEDGTEEEDGEEDSRDRRTGARGRDRRSRTGQDRDRQERNERDRTGRDSTKRDRAGLDRTGWNRNLSAVDRTGWERRRTEPDVRRWRQTEADRDGRRQAESVRNKWR